MISTKKVFGLPAFPTAIAVLVIGGAIPFFGWEYPFDGGRAEKKERIVKVEETKNRRTASPPSVEKVKIEESKPNEEPKPVEQSSLALESMSDEEYQSMVLDHVKNIDRLLVDQHFKQENVFKASLKPAERQKFDAEVKRECDKLMANSKVEGELSSFYKQTIRRCAESVVIADWQVKESIAQQDARWERYIERKRDENRRWNEEFLERMVEKFGTEFIEQMIEESE